MTEDQRGVPWGGGPLPSTPPSTPWPSPTSAPSPPVAPPAAWSSPPMRPPGGTWGPPPSPPPLPAGGGGRAQTVVAVVGALCVVVIMFVAAVLFLGSDGPPERDAALDDPGVVPYGSPGEEPAPSTTAAPPGPTTATTDPATVDTKVVEDAEAGYRLELPGDWHATDFADPGFDRLLEVLEKQAPWTAAQIEQLRESGGGLVMALDPGGSGASANLIRVPGGEVDLEDARVQVGAMFEAMGATDVAVEPTTVSGRSALLVRAASVGVPGHARATTDLQQLHVFDAASRTSWVLTVTGADPAVADAITGSFSIV